MKARWCCGTGESGDTALRVSKVSSLFHMAWESDSVVGIRDTQPNVPLRG
jgi:hypothetical protein